MSNRRFSFVILLTCVLTFSGCCVDRVYRPSACSGSWDRVLGSCDECGVCGGDCKGRTPCQSLKHLLTCGAGCDELYWGEWLSDPPDECDPCDNHGNFVGPRCCPPRLWERLKARLACRVGGADPCCHHGPQLADGMSEGEIILGDEVYEDGEFYEDAEVLKEGDMNPQSHPVPQPPTQPQPKRAAPQPTPERPVSHHVSPGRTPPMLIAPPRSGRAMPK